MILRREDRDLASYHTLLEAIDILLETYFRFGSSNRSHVRDRLIEIVLPKKCTLTRELEDHVRLSLPIGQTRAIYFDIKYLDNTLKEFL